MYKKVFAFMMAAAMMLACLAGCGNKDTASSGAIKIGGIGPLTGGAAIYGNAAKQGAEACLDALNDRDYCGVTSFSDTSKEELEVLPVSDREMIRDAIREVGKSSEGSGGTIYSDALRRAGNALAVIDNVERKHIIIVTDGDPSDREEFLDFVTDNLEKGITMSIVTVGDDLKNKEWMDMAAEMGGGKHYHIPNNQLVSLRQFRTLLPRHRNALSYRAHQS